MNLFTPTALILTGLQCLLLNVSYIKACAASHVSKSLTEQKKMLTSVVLLPEYLFSFHHFSNHYGAPPLLLFCFFFLKVHPFIFLKALRNNVGSDSIYLCEYIEYIPYIFHIFRTAVVIGICLILITKFSSGLLKKTEICRKR